MENVATLSSKGEWTSFSFGSRNIRFRTSPQLKRYIDVSTWDDGYIVCTALYENASEPVEEYIDLVPILDNLYLDAAAFCSPIKHVEVRYD